MSTRWGAVMLAILGCGRTEVVDLTDVAVPTHDAGFDAGVVCPIDSSSTRSATLGITADDRRAVWLNEALVANTTDMWFDPTTHPVRVFNHPARKNVLAVLATNLQSIPTRDRGLLASLRVGPGALVTDSTWRFAPDDGTAPAWVALAFDDASWGTPVDQGRNGAPPWGFFANIEPTARWLWSYDSATTNKPNVEALRFRRAFYVLLDGGISDRPGDCP